ncbi:hypothetical protein ACUY3K_00220 [Corynebacterium uberis]|uniref:hypothetical protein n=1 Tax=Corynebacterium TaxID=1716 RepID=UPI001D0AF837|nr:MULTISPECIES: hypothetical protein [Corynebacterium]MCZ9309141.1 hypothetical protein [Corynebacterium sp. c6VSa_13]UDL74397.1 hypothetical protein LH391_04165 [Corynebacterium uberis]UDL76769.1 hypothetical protein LH393_05230 [Corynebacterium uberis]UDL78982.1 hypothetical protein LH394_05220 [Corynebacterium uberis]UDL81259.1 hypothetical protein LH392_05640 [Corynebacterium uberis]
MTPRRLSTATAALAAAASLAATAAGAVAVAQTAQPSGDVAATAATATSASQVEEHVFSGSSTSKDAFEAWFAGGEFVKPTAETRDLTELRVNEYETAHAGDTIYKDELGHFWIKQHAVVK